MPNAPSVTLAPEAVREAFLRVKENIRRVIRGKDAVIDDTLVCLLAGGHLLIEDLPGLGKTTLAYCLARSVDCSFSRIQFTSDMLPGDLLGVSVYDESTREFVFRRGPIFANLVLADEINRTSPKTQSGLLEVMDRGRVTVDGRTHPLDEPFMVFATQNPADYESAFPLPESQTDRFLMRIRMGYPDYEDEAAVLREAGARGGYDRMDLSPVMSHAELNAARRAVAGVFVEDSVRAHILDIARATRTESAFRCGVSTRGAIALQSAARARALYSGRNHVTPRDVRRSVASVLAHRLPLRRPAADILEERAAVEAVLERLLESIPAPV